MNEWIKTNGGPLVVGAVILGALVGYIELRAPQMVGTEMDGRGLVSTQSLQNIEDKLDSVNEKVDDLKDLHNRDQEQQDQTVKKIIDILLDED